MFGHLPELFIVLLIALIVFGPEKLPEVAETAGKMVREVRQVMDDALHPEVEVPDDFATYYYESLERAGEEVPSAEDVPDNVQGNGAHPVAEETRDVQTVEARVADVPTESSPRIAEVEAEPAAPAHPLPEAPSDSSPTEA